LELHSEQTDRKTTPMNAPRRQPLPLPSRPHLPPWLRLQTNSLVLAVHLQPRASQTGVQGEQAGELRVRVCAPPVDSAANQALIEFVARTLDCPKGAVRLIRGHGSRHKLLALEGLEPTRVAGILEGLARSGRPD
jgi:uncharacterized protein